ncbi:hypothetical protein SAMN05421827_113110 [Pedobacter terrae]|uniref:Uncharacterized protein n=1 Tax=Pedobacter terrae TaxID=405671 RepID=A0A1G7YEU0_9SPHI|nr:hypothetical protein [Pedobacter terrae]SDG95058.1 hypothetical protein SAMN05421827_113110 [Pedobacter terrae]
MKTNTQKIIFSTAIAAVLLTTLNSCKKENEQNENLSSLNKATALSVKNDMLSFSSQADFNKLVKEYNQLSLKQVDEKLNSYNYHSLAKDTLNENKITDVKDPVIKRLLNKDGAINIGDKIYLLVGDKEFTIKNSDFKVYDMLKDDVNNSLLKNDTTKVIEKIIQRGRLDVKSDGKNLTVMSLSPGIKRPMTLSFLSGGTQVNYSNEYDNGRPERVKIFAWAENYTFSSSCGVSLSGEAYRKGGTFGSKSWREDLMYYSRIYGSYTITHYGIFTNTFDTGAQSLISECRNTFSSGSSGLTPIINTLNATYEWRKAPQNPQETFVKNF